MAVVKFSDLPDTASLYIFGVVEPFNDKQLSLLHDHMSRFSAQWAAHKKEVTAGWDLRYDRFILIGVDENVTELSGCSKDSMENALGQYSAESGAVVSTGSSELFYRDELNEIQCVRRDEFKSQVSGSIIDEETIVFDLTIQTIGEFRRDTWEKLLKDSWHSRAFPQPKRAGKPAPTR